MDTWNEEIRLLLRNPRPEWTNMISLGTGAKHLRVAIPCCGIVGGKQIFDMMDTKVEYENIFDLEAGYLPLLSHIINGEPRLGLKAGDCTKVQLQDLTNVDVLMAGPPCPPFSSSGNRKLENDARADVFAKIVSWCIHLGRSGSLKALLLENVAGCATAYEGKQPYAELVLNVLRKNLPGWTFDMQLGNLNSFIPQNRKRVFIRGLANRLCPQDGLPPPRELIAGPPPRLINFLCTRLPSCVRTDLSKNLRENLRDYETEVKVKMRREPELFDDRTVCMFSIDRGFDMKWNCGIFVDVAPTLTASNRRLFVVSTWDIDSPTADRVIFRYVHPGERLALMGFPTQYNQWLTPSLALKASGNAYPPPLCAMMFGPILELLAEEDCCSTTCQQVDDTARNFRMPKQKVLKKIKKKPAARKR